MRDFWPVNISLRPPHGDPVPNGHLTFLHLPLSARVDQYAWPPDNVSAIYYRVDNRFDRETIGHYAWSRDLLVELGWSEINELWIANFDLGLFFVTTRERVLSKGVIEENNTWGSIRRLPSEAYTVIPITEKSLDYYLIWPEPDEIDRAIFVDCGPVA